MQQKNLMFLVAIFFVNNGVVTTAVYAMDEEDCTNRVDIVLSTAPEDDPYELGDYDEVDPDGDDSPGLQEELERLNTIKSALVAGRYRTVQDCVRDELENKKTIWFGMWLRKNAFTKGEIVLLYELARYFFTYEAANATSCAAGLKAVLVLLVRMRQEATVMNSLFDLRTTYDITLEIRQKAKEWWGRGDLRGIPPSCNFATTLAAAETWFKERAFSNYSNSAVVAYWDFTATRYAAEAVKKIAGRRIVLPISQTGIIFNDVPADKFRGSLAPGKQESISTIRNTVAVDALAEFARYKTWSEFFAVL